MIDEKKIIEEASDVYDEMFLGDTYGTIYFDNGDQEEAHTPQQVREAFVIGVKWAEQEFVKSLWHDVSEAPKDHTNIIYMDEKGDVWNQDDYYADFYDDSFDKGWKSFASMRYVTKWCYADDILPKEETESADKQ